MKISSNIPSDIYRKILDAEKNEEPSCRVRYYPYFELQGGKLAIAVVGVKTSGKKTKGQRHKCLYIKKATVHIVGYANCFYRDIDFHGIGGYIIEYYHEPDLDNPKRNVIVNAYNDKQWYIAEAKYFRIYNAYRGIINLEFLKTLPEFKYCGYDGSVDALDYLNAYKENPKVELVAKLLSPRLAKSKRIITLAEKDKKFIEWLRAHSEETTKSSTDITAIVKAYKQGMPIEEAKREIEFNKFLSGKFSSCYKIEHLANMLFSPQEAQKRDNLIEYVKANKINTATYIDYLKALRELKIDLKAPKNFMPHDWKYWHDVRLNQYATRQAEKHKKEKAELSKKIKAVAEKYATLAGGDDEYICVIADSKGSLIFEGEMLNHCVGRMDYDQRIIKEQSLIFFIRKTETPSVPLVTVEFSLSRQIVLQCYGKNDRKPPEDIQKFVYDKWQPQAQKALKALKKKAA